MTSKPFSPHSVKSNKCNFKKNMTPVVVVATDGFSTSPFYIARTNIRYRDPPSAREALEKLNGFELAGRPIRVGLGNDKFTNESTQAILDRFDGFRSNFIEPVTRGGSERLGGKGGARAPQSLDDSDVQGVSFQNVSREALMKKLAREEPKEEPYGPGLSGLT